MDEDVCARGFDSLGARLSHAARAARSLLDARLEDAGTTAAAWFVLVRLAEYGPLIQRDLARELRVEAPTLVRQIDRLQADGLVTREPAPSDRRATLVAITDAGRARYLEVRARVLESDADLRAAFTPEQYETLYELLPLLERRARELHPRRRR